MAGLSDYLQNLHTHSTFGDGCDTPEEMTLEAINKGFCSLGFSEHSYAHFSGGACMSPETEIAYREKITELKEKYKDQIDIYCGLEWEMYSDIDLKGYDYIIGSVHYLKIVGKYVGFDRSAEEVKQLIEQYFDGDGIKYARAYYDALSNLAVNEKVDIVGHFDLITKHSEMHKLFDTESGLYRKYALDAIDVIASKNKFFEVNSGAIARGFRTVPYPSAFILQELKRRNCGIVITSDCHDKRYLDCYFKESELLLRESGFKEKYILTKNGFAAVPLYDVG